MNVIKSLFSAPTINPRRVLQSAAMGIVASQVNAQLCVEKLNEAGMTADRAAVAHKTLLLLASGLLPSVQVCEQALAEIKLVQNEKTGIRREETTMCEWLEHCFLLEDDGKMSRVTFLSDYIFEFTTYDSQMGELFASKALEVCAAITERGTFEFIKDADNYRWFLLMVNMPFFIGRLDWGTSICGAFWAHEAQTLESGGMWNGEEQVPSVEFSRDEWLCFIRALVAFARDEGDDRGPSDQATSHEPSPAQSH